MAAETRLPALHHFRCRTGCPVRAMLATLTVPRLRGTKPSQVLKMLCYLVLCIGLVTAREHNRGSSFRKLHCTRNSDCRRDLGEICYKLYDGCSQGRCMCNPEYQARDSNGRCETVRQGRDTCRSQDTCPNGMTCYFGKCECYGGEMTPDRSYCMGPNQKLLGETCSPAADKCYQKSGSGYISDEVECSDLNVHVCECIQGLKKEDTTCVRHQIGEYGCVENHHCDGGSVCTGHQCRCPLGRIPMAGNTKCGRYGALHNLQLGAPCDEIGEQRYCAHGLVCHTCGDNSRSICVKSRLPPYQSPLYAQQAAAALGPSLACLLLAVTAYLLLQR